MPVTGQWNIAGINIPDFGLSEWGSGGSAPTWANNPNVYKAAGTTQQQYSQDVAQNDQYALSQQGKAVNPYAPYKAPATPTQTQTNTGGGGGGATTPANMNEAQLNEYYRQQGYTGLQDYRDQMNRMKSAQQGISDADVQAAQNEYNYLNQQLEGRKGELQNAYDTGIRDIDIGMGQTQGAYKQSGEELNLGYDRGQKKAQQNYQTTQRLNREMARAVGAGQSSAYMDLQGSARNQYAQTGAEMQQDYTNKVNKLNSDWTAANQYAQNQKADLANKLQQGMRSIVLDQNATDFRKADAIAKIKAQANAQMAAIDAQVSSFQQQLISQAQQLAAYTKSMGTTTAGTNYLATAGGASNPYTTSTGQYVGGALTNPNTVGSGAGYEEKKM